MTITELKTKLDAMPVSPMHFGVVDRLSAWIDWELLTERGRDDEAPWLIWDDDGTVLIVDGDSCRLVIGARREGKWFACRPRERRSEEAIAAERAIGSAVEAMSQGPA